ncbi:hypothetical protein CMI37_15620 [Candidatus Pacearchaeota archaeon]|nr:hypothetical protein [Candidatus Pacearchaeota archaeon]|tara:strand:+ start:1004 stop:1210 length:207 start_codon:yes stop_codon:yes gene_type:complete
MTLKTDFTVVSRGERKAQIILPGGEHMGDKERAFMIKQGRNPLSRTRHIRNDYGIGWRDEYENTYVMR